MADEKELNEALGKLAELMEQDRPEIDPEILPSIHTAILDQTKGLKEFIAKLKTEKPSEGLLIEAKVQTKQLAQLTETLIEMFKPDLKMVKAKQSWWEKTIAALITNPIEDFKEFISEQLEKTRKNPKFAIGVKLATKDSEKFYDAMGGAVGRAVGGVMSRSAVNGLALEATLQLILTQLQTITALATGTGVSGTTTRRVTISYNGDWITERLNCTAAQTDTALVTAGASEKIVVKRVSVYADKANTVDVAARVGFGSTNTPTTTGVAFSHPGIAAGSGAYEFYGSDGIVSQTAGQDLRLTSEVPTSGSIDVLFIYKVIAV